MTNLEQLNANGSKHELQKESDEHDVVDGTNGDDDTLYDMLLVIIQHNAHFAYVFTCTIHRYRLIQHRLGIALNSSKFILKNSC